MRKLVVTLEIPDPPASPPADRFGRLQLSTPIFRAIGVSTQWPVAIVDIDGEPVRIYHSEQGLGFEKQDGTRWVTILQDMARQVVAATAPIHIGQCPPAEASTDHPQPPGV